MAKYKCDIYDLNTEKITHSYDGYEAIHAVSVAQACNRAMITFAKKYKICPGTPRFKIDFAKLKKKYRCSCQEIQEPQAPIPPKPMKQQEFDFSTVLDRQLGKI